MKMLNNLDKYKKVSQPFEVVKDKESKVLILGSFPSVKSREVGFYYMNPHNRFWKVLSIILGCDFLLLSKEEKKKELLKNKIALYDVIEECEIIASYDNSIKNVKYLDIKKILNETKIEKIICNGNKAYELFIKEFKDLKEMVIKLPSTSPANAKMKIDELVEVWKDALTLVL